jgi:hypothetical protein
LNFKLHLVSWLQLKWIFERAICRRHARATQNPGLRNLRVRQLMRRVSQHYDVEMASVLKTTQYSLLSRC